MAWQTEGRNERLSLFLDWTVRLWKGRGRVGKRSDMWFNRQEGQALARPRLATLAWTLGWNLGSDFHARAWGLGGG